ncbi:hypothetical protein D8I24_2312 (plasmid) [Cupriavidus necator H850]|nr:hypothetical protein D8I24_2312 [Cupriavidus necator H850]
MGIESLRRWFGSLMSVIRAASRGRVDDGFFRDVTEGLTCRHGLK